MDQGEHLVTAWAEHCRGPGWRTKIVWCLVRRRDGTLEQRSICCSGEQGVSREIMALLHPAAAMAEALTLAVSHYLRTHQEEAGS